MLKMKRLLAFALTLVMLIALISACGGEGTTTTTGGGGDTTTADNGGDDTTEPPSGDTKFDENVTLYVTAFVSRGEQDGRRTDPVSLYIEETLNVNLELTGVIESEYPTQLSALIAANDLPDIFLFSDATKQLPMLLASQNIAALDPYLDEYAPNTLSDPNGKVMIEANRMPANSPDGNVYLWGVCKGSWDDGTLPTCGHYIRWDVYAEAGYPELENYDEDLLDVLELMVEAEPETADGSRTYGMGAWFGDGQAWGEWVFTFGLAPQEGANLIETTGRTLAVSTVDSTPINSNQMTDPDGYYWRAMRFYNKANQRGLLDPDSFTQRSDVYEDKLKAGRYMFNVPGWMAANTNNEFNKEAGNTKTFVSLPSLQSDAEDRFGNMYRGERQYGVSAKSENIDRCVALLDFVSSYDFSLTAWNGPEGVNWNMENGVPTPTDEYLAATKDDAFGVETGANVYHHLLGYGNGSIHPDYGVAVDLYQFSEKAVAKKTNSTIQDFIDHFGQTSLIDVYRAETPVTNSVNMISFGEPSSDIVNNVNNLNAYMGRNFTKLIAAESDADFEALRDEMINDMQEFDIDGIFEYFYNEAVAQADDVEKLVNMIN